jgi:hypothetical protein
MPAVTCLPVAEIPRSMEFFAALTNWEVVEWESATKPCSALLRTMLDSMLHTATQVSAANLLVGLCWP